MKHIVSAGFAIASICGPVAAQAIYYQCDSGQPVAVSSEATLTELAIVMGQDPAKRPDYGHQLFWKPDGTAIWARTSTMRHICRAQSACRPGPSVAAGLAAAPAVRIGDTGEPELCTEPEPARDITLTVCAPDGTVTTQTIRSDDTEVLGTLGLDPAPTATHQLYQDQSGATFWSTVTASEAAVLCVPERSNTSGIANDGLWVLAMRDSTASDCPPQAVAQGEALGQSLMQSPQVIWGDPFHPSAMISDAAFDNPWSGEGASWATRAVDQDNPPIRVTVDYTFEVRDPDHIEIEGFLQFLMPADLAAVAGFGGRCEYRVTFDARRTE